MKNRDYNYSSEEFKREDAYLRAQKRLKEIKGFYWHALWYVLVNVFIVVMIAVNTDGNIWHFGTFSTPLFWGIGLGFHAMGVFGKNIFFSKKWEKRKMNEFLDKDKKRWE
ncbi:2TM domain-containing protein [Flavivirga abyssicola]|uniref:2TM domain-containing protein n=1 Tax=Flavivirga abyssicola TaxID=3063533 RepID=UPI0026E09EDA|nr:2TM domain-containing protein [Flavivirga sp. MEBiC07777]WVK13562.1 2TM domain-containing protein [Flavivirga sp. MEBiC07777]